MYLPSPAIPSLTLPSLSTSESFREGLSDPSPAATAFARPLILEKDQPAPLLNVGVS